MSGYWQAMNLQPNQSLSELQPVSPGTQVLASFVVDVNPIVLALGYPDTTHPTRLAGQQTTPRFAGSI